MINLTASVVHMCHMCKCAYAYCNGKGGDQYHAADKYLQGVPVYTSQIKETHAWYTGRATETPGTGIKPEMLRRANLGTAPRSCQERDAFAQSTSPLMTPRSILHQINLTQRVRIRCPWVANIMDRGQTEPAHACG